MLEVVVWSDPLADIFVHVMVVPAATVIVAGENMKSTISTAAVAVCACALYTGFCWKYITIRGRNIARVTIKPKK
jgi:uncharacterized MnhB-related membrane protein